MIYQRMQTPMARGPRPRLRIYAASILSVLVTGAAALTFAPAPASATPSVDQRIPLGYQPAVADMALDGLARQAALTPAQAMQRLDSQLWRAATGQRLVDQLGEQATAGMWLDQHNNAVVVNVVNARAANTVRAAGAQAQIVKYSTAQLKSVQKALTRIQPTDTAIGIDERHDRVVMSIGVKAAGTAAVSRLESVASRFGDAVRVERIADSFRITISGGDAIVNGSSRCSLGFNTTDGYGITAGHCTAQIPQWWESSTGAYYGPSVGASFPGSDYGLIRNDGGRSTPTVVNLYNGSYQTIFDAAWPATGQSVCKSGSTTGLTCGSVVATNVQACYPQGCVNGLTQSTASAQPGDSGGAWFSGSTGIGITSGIGGGYSYFQPVMQALNAYGKSIGTPVTNCMVWAGGKIFASGEYATGCKGTLAMQVDGNLVLYDENNVPRWVSNTAGWWGSQAHFQIDGNLVVYSSVNWPLWYTGTHNNWYANLVWQSNGNLEIVNTSGQVVWQTYTGH